jgi:hypothetical protein
MPFGTGKETIDVKAGVSNNATIRMSVLPSGPPPPPSDPLLDLWNGAIATGFDGGTGIATDPWLIRTGAQLAYLAQQVNGGDDFDGEYVTLTADFDLGGHLWAAIGTSSPSRPFKGVFDGDNHVIYHLYINTTASQQGLFGCLDNATIKNLGLEDINVTGSVQVGGVAGLVTGSGSVVKNSYSTGTVTGTGNYVGGIAGSVTSGGSVENSYSTAAVSGNSNVGGVAGFVYDSGSVVSDSYSTGTVSGTSFYTGGVAGYVSDSGKVENSYSTGTVSGTGSVGGVAGFVTSGGSVENSYSTGTVNGTGNNAGGVAGSVDGSGSVVKNSYSTATVTVSGTGSYAGGVAGSVTGGGSVENSYSTGTVIGNIDVGGVAGYVYDSGSVVSDSYSTGAVRGTSNVGGVAGFVNSGSVENSYSTGNVSGDSSVGGIAGSVPSGSVTDCAALNPWVKAAASDAGRVAGSVGGTFSGNVAWEDMGTNDGAAFTTSPNNAGTDISAAQVWDGLGFPFTLNAPLSPWVHTTNRLPILDGLEGQTGALPLHLQ